MNCYRNLGFIFTTALLNSETVGDARFAKYHFLHNVALITWGGGSFCSHARESKQALTMERIPQSPHFTVIADASDCTSLCGFTWEHSSCLIQHYPHKIKTTVTLMIALCLLNIISNLFVYLGLICSLPR